MKQKSITLQPGYALPDQAPNSPLGYRVLRVSNSLEFTPNDLISRRQADELCQSKAWNVTIVQPNVD